MCDDDTARDVERFLTRRQLGGAAAGLALTALLPAAQGAVKIKERDVKVKTPDGTADCYFAYPAKGKHAAVIVWPDILGLRPAFRAMGKRLAESGYAVLVVNPYYRNEKAPVVPLGASFSDPAIREKVYPLARSLSPVTNRTDALAFVEFLDKQKAVDKKRRIGTTGYCMGGSMTMRTAAALPERIGAGASFHGGRLVTDAEDSPHRLVPGMQAGFLFAIAENDDEKQPEAKHALREAFDQAGLFAEVEVYENALHGWCPPDSLVYDEANAERAWARMLALFKNHLA